MSEVKVKAARKKVTDGISKHMLGHDLFITVDMKKAKWKGKPFLSLSAAEKKHYDDLLYLSTVQEGNPHIRYT